MAPPRTLHIRCGTWEQVEAFYARKLRRGRLLSMRVPFAPALGAELTVGLELPNHEVMTIDGAVRKCEQGDGDARHWIEIELVGLSEERLRGLRDLVLLATSGRVVDSGISVIRGTDEVTPSAVAASAEPTVVGRAGLGGLGVATVAEGGGAAALAPSRPAVSEGVVARTATGGASASARTPLAPSIGGGALAPPPFATGPIASIPTVAATAALAPSADEETASRAPRHPGPASASASELPDGEPPDDERELFAALSGELRRLRQVAVHEVFDVSRDAHAEEIRAGWMDHIRRFHPDVMARHRSDALSHLAEELTILGNRAYDRLRVALVAEGRGAAFGPALFTPHGWLVGFDDLSTSDVPAARARSLFPATAPPSSSLLGATSSPAPVGHGAASVSGAAAWSSSTRSGPSPLGGGSSGGAAELGFEHVPSTASSRTGESFEAQARELLAGGDAGSAREVLATALVVYPRSRPLRSLYYVASALTALTAGQVVLATSQLETALAHHEGCVEASLVLDQIHRNGGTDHEALRKVFQ